MHETDHVVRHLMIQGQVQGVAFRANARVEAERLGLCGWVRNRSNGCVEALVAGPCAAVESFVAWARRGPALARVDHVEISSGAAPEHAEFVTLPTL
ncbi:acylphosphatase [Aromatoleum toluclasticum]|uniref:acylphosphatase n=1 Tax=Aromatoleum toluclasticum TaxID=92003 RepID=UPI001D17EA0A|nr:acylphosphatase [Aromatoleum toluclasticum]MCC4116919.1 acylphosphatase [Aromatoleum toluclasticum]